MTVDEVSQIFDEIRRRLDEYPKQREEVMRLERENSELKAQLAEAQKQPVQVLPVITEGMAEDLINHSLPSDCEATAKSWNNLFTRWFREAAEARVRPTVDVEAVMQRVVAYRRQAESLPWRECLRRALVDYTSDAPAPAADETLAAAVARVQAETRAKCAAMVREHKRRGCTGWGIHDWDFLADRMERGEADLALVAKRTWP